MKNLDNIKKEAIQAIERGIDKQFEDWVQYWEDETNRFLIDTDDLTCYLWNDDPEYRRLIEGAMRSRIEDLFSDVFQYDNTDIDIFMERFFGSNKFLVREQRMIENMIDLDEKANELENEYYTDKEDEKAFKREVNSTYL